MQCFSGFHLAGTFVIARHDASPGTKFFRRGKMLLRSGTDFCYNLHGGFLVESGNGIDNRQLLLEWGTKKAHILEDTVNILLGRIQLVNQGTVL